MLNFGANPRFRLGRAEGGQLIGNPQHCGGPVRRHGSAAVQLDGLERDLHCDPAVKSRWRAQIGLGYFFD